MNPREALVALNLVEHVGPVRLRKLLDHFGGDPVAILRADKAQLLAVNGIGPDTADAISGWERSVDLAGELKRITDFGCHIVTQLDGEYPALLREIYDPPIVLRVLARDLRIAEEARKRPKKPEHQRVTRVWPPAPRSENSRALHPGV